MPNVVRLHGVDLPVYGLWLAAADSPEVTGAQLLTVPMGFGHLAGPLLRLGVRVQPRAGQAADCDGVARRAAARVLAHRPQLQAVVSWHPDAFFTEAAPLALLPSGKTRLVVASAAE